MQTHKLSGRYFKSISNAVEEVNFHLVHTVVRLYDVYQCLGNSQSVLPFKLFT